MIVGIQQVDRDISAAVLTRIAVIAGENRKDAALVTSHQ